MGVKIICILFTEGFRVSIRGLGKEKILTGQFMEKMNKNKIAFWLETAAAKSLQSCLTLCDPIDGSPLGSPFPGILQARILEWVAISFSNAWKWKVKVKLLSCVRLLATPWTVAYQTPLSMGFSRQEYWSGVLLPSLHHVKNNSSLKILLKYLNQASITPLPCLMEKWNKALMITRSLLVSLRIIFDMKEVIVAII